MIEISILDDHSLFAQGLAEVINKSGCVKVCNVFTDIASCRTAFNKLSSDGAGRDLRFKVLLLDISLPGGSGIEFCKELKESFPQLGIVALSSHTEYSLISRMLDSGADAYVLKSSSIEDLMAAIRFAGEQSFSKNNGSIPYLNGDKYLCQEVKTIIKRNYSEQVVLTVVEKKVLKLICEGLTNPEIADKICLSTETVNWYRKRLLAKFDVKNTAALVSKAITEQLI